MPRIGHGGVRGNRLDGVHPRPGDGRVDADGAARIAGVQRGTIYQWDHRGYFKNVRREGHHRWYDPAEVITVAHERGHRERTRAAFLATLLTAT